MKARRALFAKYMKVKDPDKAHAKLSASGSERWLGCPGSVRLSDGIPSVDSVASIRGTNTHTLLQFMLENAKWRAHLKSADAKKFKEFIGYDTAMLVNAKFAYDFVVKEFDRMSAKYGTPPQIYTEQKVELSEVGFGTSDVILYHPFGVLHVMDYKNGTKAVDPEQNSQGLYYAVASADKVGWEFSELHISILQPNAPHKRGHARTWKTDYEMLERWALRLRRGAKATKKKDAPLVKNDSWCWFCPARSKCPAQMDVREKKLLERFSVLVE